MSVLVLAVYINVLKNVLNTLKQSESVLMSCVFSTEFWF
jgi:hypothetical protein